jgi:2,4-dienoyl-CoA reductase-like NADH-dependent reductase (Old Yellow Enzyme family)
MIQAAHLFSPLNLKSLTLKNRIVLSPMCQYSANDGFANDWHFTHLATRAIGGTGLIFTEAAAVTAEGRISPQDLGIWSDEHIPGLTRIVQFIESQHAVAGIQLAHAGRKASVTRPWEGNKKISLHQGGWAPLAPSAITYSENYITPTELSVTEIQNIIKSFADAANRAVQAGFKVIELHAAHGYLIHEFLSPLSNHRTDSYGGCFDHRIHFLLQILDAVKKVWPKELPIFVRISATDWAEHGWNLEESIALCKILKAKGVDIIDVSSGGLVAQQKIENLGPGYQTAFAAEIRKIAHIGTGAVGLITDPVQADHIIRTQQADLVFLGRELLRNPYWPMQAAQILGRTIEWPVQYLRAQLKN